jgi:hypothetical protein
MANANQVLAKLDAETVDGKNAPDKRRALTDESNTLRAVLQSGDAERIGKAKADAERVLKMWSAY